MEPSESSLPQLPTGGEEKEELKEADDVKLDVAEDTSETLEVEASTAAQRHLTEGKRNEQMKEADEVKLDVAIGSAVETLDAESSTAAHRHLTEGKGKQKVKMDISAHYLAERANDNCFIHKVHSGLRGDESAKHYEPILLSIGPYHHGKPPLQDMEKHKIYYSQALLDRKGQENNATYIEALKNEKGDIQAIDCYVDTFQMDVDSFEECMVLDGFFMIELFRRYGEYGKYVNNDMLLSRKWMKLHLSRDMLLFENQIPLFVLRHLFALKDHSHSTEDFVKLALAFFEFNGRPIPFDHSLTSELDIIPHLLGLVYNALVSRSAQQPNHEGKSFEFIRSAAALQDVGVKFLKAKDDAAFYDVGFSEGVLSIPHLVIDDNTESYFRNLVAYEQYSKNNSLHQVADYLQAMDCLINSAKDVELLRHCGIIDNRIGDDEKVSAMFNTLCSGVYFDQNTFFYDQMFDDVNKFCKKRRNVWMAKLKHEYFGSPWTLISFLAALLLLLLTATQTVFSVISCYRH